MKLIGACVTVCGVAASLAPGAVIAIDALRAGTASDIPATGSSYTQFRDAFAGNTIVPLTHFGAAELARVDAIVCRRQYTEGDGFAPDELAAIHAFTTRAVFVSDSSLWGNTGAGSDYPISYGDNLRLLTNIISYIGVGHGALFVDDGGFAFGNYPMSALMGPYGIYFDNPPIPPGRPGRERLCGTRADRRGRMSEWTTTVPWA